MPDPPSPVLFIINNLFAMGGAERNLLNLLRYDQSAAFDTVVATSQYAQKKEPFSILKTLYIGQRFSLLSALIWALFTFIKILVNYLFASFPDKPKNWRPNIFHGILTLPSGLIAVFLGRVLHKKSVVSVQGQDLYFFNDPILRPLQTYILHHADQVIVQTQWQWQYLDRQLHGKTSHNTVLPNGINLKMSGNVPFNRTLFQKQTLNLLFIGRLIPVKRPLLLIDILDEIQKNPRLAQHHLHLTIIGEGPLSDALQQRIRHNQLGKLISYHPFLPHEQIRRTYYEHDLLIVLSTSEGLPNVILEAIAAKCPVLSTYFPGINEVISNGHTGIIVFSDKPHDIAVKIQELISTPHLATSICDNEYTYVRQTHDFVQIIKKQYRLYQNLIRTKTPNIE